MTREGGYVPALRFHALSGFYDSIAMAIAREGAWKPRLAALAAPVAGERVLDVGCGTGTLALMLKRRCPEASVVGLDRDPRMLERARRKAMDAGLAIEFRLGAAEAPPDHPAFADGSFDACVSSLFLHHLAPRNKARALRQAHRLLRPSGRLWIADYGAPATPLGRLGFLATRLLDGFENTRDHAAGRLPGLIAQAGFGDVAEAGRWPTAAGTICLWCGLRA